MHAWTFAKGEVELWWPADMGKQPLYEVGVDLVDMVRFLKNSSRVHIAELD